MQNIQDIRNKFIQEKENNNYVIDKSGCKLLELTGESFICDDETIFGEINRDYVKRELEWYNSQSLYVKDIPGKTPQIWLDIAGNGGQINSNYGWCIFSEENHRQYTNVLKELNKNPNTRQAVMVYTRPSIHHDAYENGKSDFICTNTVQYLIRDKELRVVVNMRSNDVVFGFRNDFAWQAYVAELVRKRFELSKSTIIWQTGSLHIYERHFDLVN